MTAAASFLSDNSTLLISLGLYFALVGGLIISCIRKSAEIDDDIKEEDEFDIWK